MYKHNIGRSNQKLYVITISFFDEIKMMNVKQYYIILIHYIIEDATGTAMNNLINIMYDERLTMCGIQYQYLVNHYYFQCGLFKISKIYFNLI